MNIKIDRPDATDMRIIAELMSDARATNSAIARALGSSEETIRRRIKRLDTGGLLRFLAVPDFRQLGYEMEVQVFLQVSAAQTQAAMAAMAALNLEGIMIGDILAVTGRYDLTCHAYVQSPAKTSELRRVLGELPGVMSMDIMVILASERRFQYS